jgi:hypothetical protein
LGLAVAGLTKLGIDANVKFELVTTTQTFAKHTHHEVKAEDFLMAWTQEHPTFRALDAIRNFRDNGRSDGACYTAIRMLRESGALQKLGPGNYARADVAALAAPGKKTKPEKTKREVTHGEFILRLARRTHGRVSLAKIKQAFADDGRAVTSVHPTLADLVGKDLIKRDGDGMFEVIANAPAKHLNGSSEGVTLNG